MSTVELHLDRGAALMAERSHRSTRARLAAALLRGWGFGMVVIDSLVVLGAFLLAHWARFILPDASGQAMGLDEYARIGLIVSLITVVLFAMNDLYDTERSPAWPVLLRSVLSSISTALVLAVAVSYFLGDQAYSRLWFASGWLFAVVSMLIWRSCAHRLYELVRDSQAHTRRILIVGSNPLGDELARELASVNHVVGFADNGSDLTGSDTVPLLGPISDIERLVHSYGVDELVIALPPSRREQVSHLLERGFHRRVTVKFLPYMEELLPHRFDLHDTAGRRYIRFWSAARVSWFKRAMDLILVSAGLLMLLPLLGLIALAIKLDSPGPVFYGQTRVGRNGRHFKMLKFRSMSQDADRRRAELQHHNEAIGPLFKIRNDPRITRVGGFLRRWSIDELPQLLNVLRGDMSLVGPRPPIPSEVAEYEDWQLGRLRALPGLTGLWQVSGRSEVPFHDMVRLDLHYIRNWSVWLDLEILLRTVPAVLTSRGAY